VIGRTAALLATLAVAHPAAAQRVYVASQEAATVTVIDVATNDVVHTVDLAALGFSPTAKPHHTAVEPDGSYWYVTLIGEGKVLKFTRGNELVGQLDLEVAGMIAMQAGGDLLVASRSMSAVNPPSRVGLATRADMTIEEVDVPFPRPHAAVADPRGRHVWVGSLGVNQIATIDVNTGDMAITTLEGERPHVFVQFAVSPDGSRLVATTEHSNQLLVFDSTDPVHLTLLRSLDVEAKPWHPSFSPDGRFVWFGNQGANAVTVVDAKRWKVDTVIRGEGLAEPHGSVVSADGQWVYISSRNAKGTYRGQSDERPGTVVVIDAATRRIVKVIEIGRYAAGLSVSDR
jgi:YVTN family beta-propeller protein